MTYTVTFRDGASVRGGPVEVSARPIFLPRGVRVLSESASHLELGPASGEGRSAAESVAGSLPLVCGTRDGVEVAWLDIDPPAPLTLENLMEMWLDIETSAVPIPQSVSTQGDLPPGRVSAGSVLAHQYLYLAVRAARKLASEWPGIREQSRRWEFLELSGGIEDPVWTDRRGGALQAICDSRGDLLPIRTARKVLTPTPWRSSLLANSAAAVLAAVRDAEWLVPPEARVPLTRPFEDVVRNAAPLARVSDQPVSAWPSVAKAALQAFQTATAVVEAVASQESSGPRAPLCYVWRLFEAWTAVQALRALDTADDWTRMTPVLNAAGAEWFATWRNDKLERSVTVCAQLAVGARPTTLGGQLRPEIVSISSDLRPDCTLISERKGTPPILVVVDAKQRSAIQMDPTDAAESGSKYIWGLRLEGVDVPDPIVVSTVLLATTARPAPMHQPKSRIVGCQLLVDSTADFSTLLLAELES